MNALPMWRRPSVSLAGCTKLVDPMKEDVEWPRTLTDVNRLPLHAIEELAASGLRLGALATNSETAGHPVLRARYPVLLFLRHGPPCNKRAPGAASLNDLVFGDGQMMVGTDPHAVCR